MKYTLIEILQDKWWLALLAFGVSLIATPVVRAIAYRMKIVDRPDSLLKPHEKPIAYLGGVAIWTGLVAGLIAYALILPDVGRHWGSLGKSLAGGEILSLLRNPLWNLGSVVAASALIMLIGLLDDVLDITPRRKLLGQMLAAGLLLLGGVGTRMAQVLFSPLSVVAPPWVLTVVSAVMCIGLVISACNAANLLDGLDGLCSGVTSIISLGFLALAIWLAVWGFYPGTDGLRVALCLAMAGAVIGFLPYNRAPATIFMGDAGSMLLGFFVATMMALFCQEGNIRWFLAACVVFFLPILDTSLALIRRFRSGRSIFAGDRSHLYDQLVDRGMTVQQVVGLFYDLAILSATLGVIIGINMRLRYALPIYAVLLLIVFRICWRFGFVVPEGREAREASPPESTPSTAPLKILFTSAGRRVSLLEQFRHAARKMNVDLEIHAADCDPLAPALQVADMKTLVEPIGTGDYCGELLAYCRSHGIDALIPLLDPELPLLADARDDFEQAGTTVMISSPEMVRACIDKVAWSEFLSTHGFRTPRILTDPELADPPFPLFLKPRDGSSSLGAHKITTPEGLAYYRHIIPNAIVQEFIEGVEYTVDVFADFNGRPQCAVPRRRHEVRGGEVSKSHAVLNREIMKEACRLVESLGGAKGMVTVQCFLTDQEQVVFIECNPRFGGGVPLSIRAGADSPRWIIEMLLGREPSITMDGWSDGTYMLRYDEGVFLSKEDLLQP